MADHGGAGETHSSAKRIKKLGLEAAATPTSSVGSNSIGSHTVEATIGRRLQRAGVSKEDHAGPDPPSAIILSTCFPTAPRRILRPHDPELLRPHDPELGQAKSEA
jgi:hypothetical protein